MMICQGRDAFTGKAVEVHFGSEIDEVGARAAADDTWLAPGWIDIQVNGFAGVDYNSPHTPHAEIARSIHVLYATGVTRFYPTVITGGPDDMREALRNLARAKETLPEGGAIEGFHVEGPHISPEDGPRGAHPQHWVRRPDIDEYRRWQEAAQGAIRLITLSPEWPEAPAYIERIVEDGVVASIGHTKATRQQLQDAVSAGATMSTHLGNGAHAVVTRHPNYIWEQLADDRLAAGFITDGIHLPACYVKVAFRAKGVERCFLVTDASSPAGAAPGRYRLGEQEVDLTEDERVVLAGRDKLAGSALRMDRGIERAMELGEISMGDAVRMATVNAARAAKIDGRTQGLAAGERADLVRFRFEGGRIEVLETYAGGERVYRAAS
jgi:N-acetylglucosamine-6-phosphate deacetylase